jgi:hypothetical protein
VNRGVVYVGVGAALMMSSLLTFNYCVHVLGYLTNGIVLLCFLAAFGGMALCIHGLKLAGYMPAEDARWEMEMRKHEVDRFLYQWAEREVMGEKDEPKEYIRDEA